MFSAGEVMIRRITITIEKVGTARKPKFIGFTFAEYAERDLAGGDGWYGLSRAGLAALHALARDPGAGVVLDTAGLCAVT